MWEVNEKWIRLEKTIVVYRTCHDVINYCGPYTMGGGVFCCLSSEFFLIGFLFYWQIWWILPKTILFAWHGKMFKSTYSPAVVIGSCPLLSFWKPDKSLNPPKCTCCKHRCVPSDGNAAVSIVRNWLTYVSELQLKWLLIKIWWT